MARDRHHPGFVTFIELIDKHWNDLGALLFCVLLFYAAALVLRYLNS